MAGRPDDTVACALLVILSTAILTGLSSMMLAGARHSERHRCQAKIDEERVGYHDFPDEYPLNPNTGPR
ncbi:hypothetical protein B1H18_21585 [Streptomyces tsukubensis]|uniref:Uncharacterized protein n=2 Tax=Streptomyces tsukubensis TaxID=83656 RepID=A0A1V4A5T6_9ACTN|nr:hypothetical protein B1H18_21585 [Streptomyces tsukubensis]